MPKVVFVLPLFLVLAIGGCAHNMIPGTQVEDTEDNRSVVNLLAELRRAMEERDTEALVALVSRTYFEDMGTATPEDDYGYVELTTRIVPDSFSVTQEFYVTFEVHDVVVDGERAHADLRYSSRARIQLPTETLWDSHKEFNRVQLTREDGDWRIISGL